MQAARAICRRGHWHAIMHAFRGQPTDYPLPGCAGDAAAGSFCTSLGGHAFSLDGSHWCVTAPTQCCAAPSSQRAPLTCRGGCLTPSLACLPSLLVSVVRRSITESRIVHGSNASEDLNAQVHFARGAVQRDSGLQRWLGFALPRTRTPPRCSKQQSGVVPLDKRCRRAWHRRQRWRSGRRPDIYPLPADREWIACE